MKIGLMSLAGTPVKEIAEVIADRLDLVVVGEPDVKAMQENADVITYNNFMSDSLCDITFGLYTSLLVNEIQAKTLHEQRENDKVFTKELLMKQTVFMDVTLCDSEFVAEEIIRILADGSYGFYVPPWLVFPNDVQAITGDKIWSDAPFIDREHTVFMCGDCYKLTGNDVDAYQCLKRKSLMKVAITKAIFDIQSLSELAACGKILHQDFGWAVKFYEMLLYSVKFGFEDVESGYANAFQNAARPWERVHALGIQVI